MSAPALRKCPECGRKVKRLPGTGGGILFKGSGFYATDYRSDNYRKAQKAEKTEPAAKKETGKSGSKKAGS